MGTHKYSRKLHISFPRVHHLLACEALEVNQTQVNKPLNKGEVPTIAEIISQVNIKKLKSNDKMKKYQGDEIYLK